MNQVKISVAQAKQLNKILRERFEENKNRHLNIKWDEVLKNLEKTLENSPNKISSLLAMEESGGEPDVIAQDSNTKEYVFCDCSPESPSGRRSLCYDEAALNSRKKNKPIGSATGMAQEMGIELLDENHYYELQKLGAFDTKTSSWVKAPKEVRDLGGGLFGDFRYGRTFIYHNGAESYYASRGFRGMVRI